MHNIMLYRTEASKPYTITRLAMVNILAPNLKIQPSAWVS